VCSEGSPCDKCEVPVAGADRVDQYRFNAHTFKFQKLASFCAACARREAENSTIGQPEEWALDETREIMYSEYGGLVDVRWLQGDEHHILVQVSLAWIA
jgi:hypothetical protein